MRVINLEPGEAVPARDKMSRFIFFRIVIGDISKPKRTEDLLRESEQKLKNLFELLPVGVSVLDADNKIAYMNPALEKILDISREGLLRGDYRNRTYLRPDGACMSADEFASNRAIRETILLVEDEPTVLSLTTLMLEKQGYTVLAAKVREALEER